MIHTYYAIYDRAAKSYVHIFESANNATAGRLFEALAKNKETFVGVKPEDFALYSIAQFNDQNGTFQSHEPEKIMEGKSE